MKHIGLFTIISLIILTSFNPCCDKDDDPFNKEFGEIIDPRDGKVYKWVKIGDQIWFAENLNYGTKIEGSKLMSDDDSFVEKYCYDDKAENCDVLGGLYQWEEAMNYDSIECSQGICPVGWHVPSDLEWITLESFVDSKQDSIEINWDTIGYRGNDAGKNLKSKKYWVNDKGFNKYGFNALGAGVRVSEGSNFGDLDSLGFYWTSSLNHPLDSNLAWIRILDANSPQIRRKEGSFRSGRSIRCVKD